MQEALLNKVKGQVSVFGPCPNSHKTLGLRSVGTLPGQVTAQLVACWTSVFIPTTGHWRKVMGHCEDGEDERRGRCWQHSPVCFQSLAYRTTCQH